MPKDKNRKMSDNTQLIFLGNDLICKTYLIESEFLNIEDLELKVDFKYITNLNGEKEKVVYKVGDGSIIKLFDRTPFPKNDSDVVCPHFLELKWANGCFFDCAWCYLNGTFRFLKRGKKPFLKDRKKTTRHLLAFFENANKPYLLNSGELSDSLVFEHNGFALTKNLVPLFMEQDEHKLLILTKSTNIKNLLNLNAQDHVIVSFSLNSFPVAERWENKAPHPKNRINSAKKLESVGYNIRIRIDPLVPIRNWKESYINLIDCIFNAFTPERVTIGSLRGLQSTINNSKDVSWTKYLSERSNWGKKIKFDLRYEMYYTLIKHLIENWGFDRIALCKETLRMWNKLGLDYRKIKCNCVA